MRVTPCMTSRLRRARLDAIAARHGLSPDAALALFRAIEVGRGVMAQFNHPELGGMGQWLRTGMVMVGDMLDTGLKRRVGEFSSELAALLNEGRGPFSEAKSGQAPPWPDGAWWPAELGAAASSGAQDKMRYAYFPASHRLAVQVSDQLSLYDTGTYRIFGVSQQQGSGRSLVFSSDRGEVRLEDLPLLDAAGNVPPQTPPPALASAPPAGDPLSLIERLAGLRAKGVLTEGFMRQTDIAVCLLPLTRETEGILGARTFALMPRGAMVINIGRGRHVVEADLIAALDSGQLSHAALDALYPEPLPPENPLWRHPRVTVMPHVARRPGLPP
jgi:hypothetical protein